MYNYYQILKERAMDLKEFQKACINKESDIVVQQYLIEGSNYFFENYYDRNEEFIFKKELAESLDIHVRDIAIVGSSKLGFSIKPEQGAEALYLYKKFDFDYLKNDKNDKSDIDIAIISSRLFDKQLFELYKYTNSYAYKDIDKIFGNQKTYIQHSKYILKGWLRPDKIPRKYNISSTIEDFREKYKKKYGRKINFGIYKSWDYFESYHANNIKILQLNLISQS